MGTTLPIPCPSSNRTSQVSAPRPVEYINGDTGLSLHHGPAIPTKVTDDDNANLTALNIELYAHSLETVPLPVPDPGAEADPVAPPVCPNTDGSAALAKRGGVRSRGFRNVHQGRICVRVCPAG